MTQSRNKLKIYQYLFQNPIYCERGQDATLEILKVHLSGTASFCAEAFKTVVWAAQQPNVDKTYQNGKLVFLPIKIFITLEGSQSEDFYSILKRVNGSSIIDWYLDQGYIDNVQITNNTDSEGQYDYEIQEYVVKRFKDDIDDELKRIAQNVDISYALAHKEAVSIKRIIRNFEMSFYYDFIDQSADEKKKSYNADSSIASALHINNKILYCRQYAEMNQLHLSGEETLGKAINLAHRAVSAYSNEEKKYLKLYHQLSELEHRRWNAYMVSRGYRCPTEQETDYIYDGENTHVDKKNKLHPAICEYRRLKKMSQLCQDKLEKRTEEIKRASFWLDEYAFLNSRIFWPLKKAISNLFNETGNANAIYDMTLRRILESEEYSEYDKAKIKKLDENLNPVKLRNQRTQFEKYDEQMIDSLLFCVWYRKQNGKIIVFSDGILSNDVILPTLLMAERMIFVGEKTKENEYESRLREYLKKRKMDFVKHSVFQGPREIAKEEIENFFDKLLDGKVPSEIIIAGTGKLKEEFIRRYPDVCCVDFEVGEVISRWNSEINSGLVTQELSIEEFLNLNAGRIIGVGDLYIEQSKLDILTELYWKSAREGNGVWNHATSLLENRQELVMIPIQEGQSKIKKFEGYFSAERYLSCGMDAFLTALSEYHIIWDFSVDEVTPASLKVSFRYVEQEIGDLIQKYTINEKQLAALSNGKAITEKKIIYRPEFSPITFKEEKRGMRKARMKFAAVNEAMAGKNESPDVFNQMRVARNRFFKKLASEKIGVNVTIDEVNLDVSEVEITDVQIANLLLKSGDMLELLTRISMQSSGLFDDVQSNISFAWSGEDYISPNVLAERKLRGTINEQIGKRTPGYSLYKEALLEIGQLENSEKSKNEIDVIATRGMQAFFVSCKSRNKIETKDLQEIALNAAKFHAVPIFITSLDMSEKEGMVKRAKELGVSLVDGTVLQDMEKFNHAMQQVVSGMIFSIL